MKKKITCLIFALLLLTANTLPFTASAAVGRTAGGPAGILNITYNIYFNPYNLQATTSAATNSPNPKLGTYVEGTYFDFNSNTLRLITGSNVDSVTIYPPASCTFHQGKSVHTSNSTEWGYFQGVLYAP